MSSVKVYTEPKVARIQTLKRKIMRNQAEEMYQAAVRISLRPLQVTPTPRPAILSILLCPHRAIRAVMPSELLVVHGHDVHPCLGNVADLQVVPAKHNRRAFHTKL